VQQLLVDLEAREPLAQAPPGSGWSRYKTCDGWFVRRIGQLGQEHEFWAPPVPFELPPLMLANGRTCRTITDVQDDGEAGQWATHRAHHMAAFTVTVASVTANVTEATVTEAAAGPPVLPAVAAATTASASATTASASADVPSRDVVGTLPPPSE
jgi:hypothetical protein